ncbi:MAG: hypothetical protein QM664_07870, partial [Flavihumibacter sp.]
AGVPCFMMARVKNNGNTAVVNATVKFYWANPSIGPDRNTATLVGQSFVSIDPGGTQEVLCLSPWTPVFVNNGHECLIVECFHPQDPLPATLAFNVPTDRHVAQKNLAVVNAQKSMFHFPFEVHNGSRKDRKYHIRVRQQPLAGAFKKIPESFRKLKEGKLGNLTFNQSRCMPESAGNSDHHTQETQVEVTAFGKFPLSITGKITEEVVFLAIEAIENDVVIGGQALVITNY